MNKFFRARWQWHSWDLWLDILTPSETALTSEFEIVELPDNCVAPEGSEIETSRGYKTLPMGMIETPMLKISLDLETLREDADEDLLALRQSLLQQRNGTATVADTEFDLPNVFSFYGRQIDPYNPEEDSIPPIVPIIIQAASRMRPTTELNYTSVIREGAVEYEMRAMEFELLDISRIILETISVRDIETWLLANADHVESTALYELIWKTGSAMWCKKRINEEAEKQIARLYSLESLFDAIADIAKQQYGKFLRQLYGSLLTEPTFDFLFDGFPMPGFHKQSYNANYAAGASLDLSQVYFISHIYPQYFIEWDFPTPDLTPGTISDSVGGMLVSKGEHTLRRFENAWDLLDTFAKAAMKRVAPHHTSNKVTMNCQSVRNNAFGSVMTLDQTTGSAGFKIVLGHETHREVKVALPGMYQGDTAEWNAFASRGTLMEKDWSVKALFSTQPCGNFETGQMRFRRDTSDFSDFGAHQYIIETDGFTENQLFYMEDNGGPLGVPEGLQVPVMVHGEPTIDGGVNDVLVTVTLPTPALSRPTTMSYPQWLQAFAYPTMAEVRKIQQLRSWYLRLARSIAAYFGNPDQYLLDRTYSIDTDTDTEGSGAQFTEQFVGRTVNTNLGDVDSDLTFLPENGIINEGSTKWKAGTTDMKIFAYYTGH